MRRDVRGGKRGDGDRRHQRIRRADPTRIHRGKEDATLTGVAGLARPGAFVGWKGIDAEFRRLFFRPKRSVLVVYPMDGAGRGCSSMPTWSERHASSGSNRLRPIRFFVRLAGGVVPSLDTVYRDLCRFDDQGVADLEAMMVDQGLASVHVLKTKAVHLDVDTTVECVFGLQEGALPGSNPRYCTRASYHPILVYCAEAGACVGALLRPGDTGLRRRGCTDDRSLDSPFPYCGGRRRAGHDAHRRGRRLQLLSTLPHTGRGRASSARRS